MGACLFNFQGWRVPHQADRGEYPILLDWGVPHPRSGQGDPIPGLDREDPIPRGLDGGYPIPDLGGGTSGYTLHPLARTGWGTPNQEWIGYPPWQELDGVPPLDRAV